MPPSPFPRPPPSPHNHNIDERRIYLGERKKKEQCEREKERQSNTRHTQQLSMARNLPLYEELADEEDYIDMDISSTTFLCYSVSSPPDSREFEFQFHMSSNPPQREANTSPADELFYKGKLLPLHLPPRLQMVQKLLENSTIPYNKDATDLFEDHMETTNTTKDTATTTPFESCNISPATSCYVSGELNPEEYYYECSTKLLPSKPKKSWSKKLKLIKQSSLSHKLKASRAYLKSLFTKSGCSAESSAVPKDMENSNSFLKASKKNPFGQIQKERHEVAKTNATSIMTEINGEKVTEDECGHRRSFSGIIKWHSRTKSMSNSSSSCCSSSLSSSSGVGGQQGLRRSSSVNSEVESSIQGAIAYCKMSQKLVGTRKSVSDIGLYSSTASRIAAACENQGRPRLCRG